MDDLALAAEFPPATREGWDAAVARVLKGADPERRLVSRTADGLRVAPIYPRHDGPSGVAARPAAPWRVAARIDHPDPAEANALALADLEGGADALAIVPDTSAAARGFGLRADAAALERSLDGVMLDMVALRLDGGDAAEALIGLAESRGHDLAGLDVELGLDPVGAAARAGGFAPPWTDGLAALAPRLAALARRGFRGRLVAADGRPYHEAGASEAQELAAVLATAVAYLRALEGGGHDLASAREALSFTLVADADEFLTVAKLRALRRLWARIEAACGLAPAPIRLHAETAWRMTTRRDPWVNLLRGTLAAFSAGIGGADSVSVLPFTAALGLPDGFARRLARNTQIILQEETNLWRVADPTAGSGAFEAVTAALAREAWDRFVEIEREGGIAGSLGAGALQGRIAAARAGRETAVATRRQAMTGTSEFPDLAELPVAVLRPSPPPAVPPPDPAGPAFPRLPSGRAAEPYEALRDRSDAHLARHGRRPRVLLVRLGPVAAYTARSTFARNAFAAVGIESVPLDGAAEPEALSAALRDAGTRLACLCSSDERYEEDAAPAARALAAAGASRIYLAGRPGPEHEAAWRAAGIGAFLAVGSDLLALAADALPAAAAD